MKNSLIKPNGAGKSPPNIILFIYDSLSPAMLSALGGKIPTPAFDFFAHKGVCFKRTAAHSLRSDVALAGILTGCYPHRNGVHKLILQGGNSAMGRGYQYDKCIELVTLAVEHDAYRIRLFNCDALNSCMPKVSWRNRPLVSPHMEQLNGFMEENRYGPFLLVDRFKSLAFPWRQEGDRVGTDAQHRELAVRAIGSQTTKELLVSRMQEAVRQEDARLDRIIKMLWDRSIIDNTIVVITGLAGDLNETEMEALSNIGGYEPSSPPLFPTIFWYPPHLQPAVVEDSLVRHIDIIPTFRSLAGLQPHDGMDGVDLLPALKGGRPFPDETLLFSDDNITLYKSGKSSTIKLDSADLQDRKPTSEESSTQVYGILERPQLFPKRNDALLQEHAIPKTSVFFISYYRSGSQFFSAFFQRPEFQNVICKGHCWPLELYDINILYWEKFYSKERVKKEIGLFKKQISSFQQEVFVCVTHDSWAMLDILAELFVNSKFVFITRDPRNAVPSVSTLPNVVQYSAGKLNIGSLPEYERLSPSHQWHLVWDGKWIEFLSSYWDSQMKSCYESIVKLKERALTVRFEDIFDPKGGFSGMKRISEFLENEINIPTENDWLHTVFGNKINAFPYSYPRWKDWTDKDKSTLLHACGDTMSLLGYDPDKEP